MGMGPLNAPGPGFFPAVIGVIFSILSLALFIGSFTQKNQVPGKMFFWREGKNWKKVFFALLSLIFYLIFLNYWGYLITTFLMIFFLLKFVGKRGWTASILTAFLVSLGTYAIFKMGLRVSLPKGLIIP
jgi:putative tricarboxylic transport membrane protein